MFIELLGTIEHDLHDNLTYFLNLLDFCNFVIK